MEILRRLDSSNSVIDRLTLKRASDSAFSMTPAPSEPGIYGSVGLILWVPLLIYVSTGLIPAQWTLTKTCMQTEHHFSSVIKWHRSHSTTILCHRDDRANDVMTYLITWRHCRSNDVTSALQDVSTTELRHLYGFHDRTNRSVKRYTFWWKKCLRNRQIHS